MVRVEVVLQVGIVTVKEKGGCLSRGSIASRDSNSKRERVVVRVEVVLQVGTVTAKEKR